MISPDIAVERSAVLVNPTLMPVTTVAKSLSAAGLRMKLVGAISVPVSGNLVPIAGLVLSLPVMIKLYDPLAASATGVCRWSDATLDGASDEVK